MDIFTETKMRLQAIARGQYVDLSRPSMAQAVLDELKRLEKQVVSLTAALLKVDHTECERALKVQCDFVDTINEYMSKFVQMLEANEATFLSFKYNFDKTDSEWWVSVAAKQAENIQELLDTVPERHRNKE